MASEIGSLKTASTAIESWVRSSPPEADFNDPLSTKSALQRQPYFDDEVSDHCKYVCGDEITEDRGDTARCIQSFENGRCRLTSSGREKVDGRTECENACDGEHDDVGIDRVHYKARPRRSELVVGTRGWRMQKFDRNSIGQIFASVEFADDVKRPLRKLCKTA